jgi:predicted glycosyltransferase
MDRLDVLLYAHDGRGLGHVSRAAAIGLALRRLAPELKVCLVSGCRHTAELIGGGELDWLKLPAYRTEVKDGMARGVTGSSGYSDTQLGQLRGEQLAFFVGQFHPRVVLVDHSPQGKHRELLPALAVSSEQGGTCWLLGVRGVVGEVKQLTEALARDTFARYYQGLLWYGDEKVIGAEPRCALERSFGTVAQPCGYVSRLRELQYLPNGPLSENTRSGGTVSVPWLGEHTLFALEQCAQALEWLGGKRGRVSFFLGEPPPDSLHRRLTAIAGVTVEPFSARYADSLLRSSWALVFGGYNSVIDVLAADVAAVVIVRDMRDGEQRRHLDALRAYRTTHLITVPEAAADAHRLCQALAQVSRLDPAAPPPLALDGAQNSARAILSHLNGETGSLSRGCQ